MGGKAARLRLLVGGQAGGFVKVVGALLRCVVTSWRGASSKSTDDADVFWSAATGRRFGKRHQGAARQKQAFVPLFPSAPLCRPWRSLRPSWRPWCPSLRLGVPLRLCASKQNADNRRLRRWPQIFLVPFAPLLAALASLLVPLASLSAPRRCSVSLRPQERR